MHLRGRVGGMNGKIGVEAQHQVSGLLVTESGPFLLRGQGITQVKGFGYGPGFRFPSPRRMMANDLLQPPSHHLGKAHFIFRSKPFRFAKKFIGNLNLCFYHDGDLPSVMGGVKFWIFRFGIFQASPRLAPWQA